MTASTGASDRRGLAVAGWVIFVLLVVYAVLVGGGWAGIHLVTLRTVSLVLVAVALVGWFLVSLRDPRWRPQSAIWPTLVLPLVALVLSTLASAWPRLGVEYVAWAMLLVALYLLLVRILATETARARIGALAAMLSLVIGLLYVGQVLVAWIEWWGLVGGPAVPPLRPLYAGLSLGGPGSVQVVQVLVTVIAIAGLGLGDRSRQVLAGVLIGLTAIVVVLTASRAGWLALAGAVVLTLALWFILAARQGSLRDTIADRWSQRGVSVVVAVAAVAAGGLALILAPVLLDRFLNSGSGGREQYFTVALRMFEDAPLIGHGPGTWAVRRVAYTEPGELDHYIPDAHNIYLQTLAELGLVGALLGILALVPVAWLIWRGLSAGQGSSRRWAWAALFILLFIGLYNVVSFQMNVPAVMLLAALPVAWLDATTRDGVGVGRVGPTAALWLGRAARIGLWVGCAAAVIVLFRVETVATTHQSAVSALYASDADAARTAADEAYRSDPDYPAYAITRGLVASADGDWDTAGAVYRSAAETDEMAQSWLGLAQAQEALGEPAAEVAASIERALRIGSQQPSIVLAAGHLYERLGDLDRAADLYAESLARYPSLAADPYWAGSAGSARSFDDILDLAFERAPGRAWEVALAAGDPDVARDLAASQLQHSIIDAWDGDPSALQAVYEAADAATADPNLLGWAARLATRDGDDEQAQRYQRLAVFEVTEGGELPGTEIEIDQEGYLEAVPAGTKVNFAGHYLYRRPLNIDLLPPGLPRLVFPAAEEAADR